MRVPSGGQTTGIISCPLPAERLASESNVWRMRREDGSCVGHLLVYVDDMLLLTEPEVAQAFIAWLKKS